MKGGRRRKVGGVFMDTLSLGFRRSESVSLKNILFITSASSLQKLIIIIYQRTAEGIQRIFFKTVRRRRYLRVVF